MTFGKRLRALRRSQSMTQDSLAQELEISKSAVSMYELNHREPDFKLMRHIADFFAVDLDYLYGRTDVPRAAAASAATRAGERIARLYDRASDIDKSLVEKVLTPYEEALPDLGKKIIPLYVTPAAAGYASPAQGEDYDDYEVPFTSKADFAARISGDSMEPYIPDGGIVLVSRQKVGIGDVGLFFIDGDLKCKQYCRDNFGNVYLFSLNRNRADADVTISASSGSTLYCFGKVLMENRIPLPN